MSRRMTEREKCLGYVSDVLGAKERKLKQSSWLTIYSRSRHLGVWTTDDSPYVSVTDKDEAIIADICWDITGREGYLVRATYRVPPYSNWFEFYAGFEVDEAKKAFDSVFDITLEEALEKNIKKTKTR